MTNQERIDALPMWQRMQFDNLVAAKMKENWIPRNAAAVEAILETVEGTPDPWGPQPAADEPEAPETPETPEEPAAPVEGNSQTITIMADVPGSDEQ